MVPDEETRALALSPMMYHVPRKGQGMNLVEAMESKGITVAELSEMSGVSVSTIRRMRSDANQGNLYSWKMVATALCTPVSELIGEFGDGWYRFGR